MQRMKTRASRTVSSSSSSSDEDISLGASSSDVSRRRSGVPSQRNRWTRKYEAQWKDDLSM